MTAPPADPDLLARFLADRDEAAFAELVRRHAPGVWGACRRRLDHLHDAEDAFQAAFLVLVRRADRLRPDTPLGPWLGKVAALTARNVLRGNRRRATVSGPLEHDVAAAEVAAPPVDLDAALRDLPDADRAAVTLCHLDGLSRKEAAERLGCPEGTLSARLSRALGKLRVRLADEVPPGLVRRTVRVAVVAGVSTGPAGLSPAVAQIAEEAIRMLWVKKLTAAGLVLAAAGMVGVGVARTADAGGQDKGTPATAKADKPAGDVPKRMDATEAHRRELIDLIQALYDQQAATQRRIDELVQVRGPAKADKPAADRVAELEKVVRELREENRRLKGQAAEVTKFLGDQLDPRGSTQPPAVRFDPPPAAPKATPPADLEKRIADAEAAAQFHQRLAQKLRDELGQARPAGPAAPPKPPAAKLDPPAPQPYTPTPAELERVAEHADAAVKAAEAQVTQARERQQRVQQQLQLARLAARKAEKDKPAADPAADLQRQFDNAENEVKAAQGRMSEALTRREALYGRLKLARQAAAKELGKGKPAADLTLTILGDVNAEWAARYQLTERAGGKPVFYLTPSPEGLAKLLARAKADPNGPKTVAVEAEESCPMEHLRAALAVLKAAGFKTVTYKGPLEGDLHGAAKGPGAWTYDRTKEYTGPIDLADAPPAAPGKKE